jgi:hypothetical protein
MLRACHHWSRSGKKRLAASKLFFVFKRKTSALLGIALILAGGFCGAGIAEAQGPIISRGDGVVTGFSGIKQSDAATNPVTDPLSGFFIDLDGPSMQIFQLGAIREPMQGQLLPLPAAFS